MKAVMRPIKATYNFFAGDAIILVAVIIAFVVATVLVKFQAVSNGLVALIFAALIVGGLTLTLARERPTRARP